MPKEKKVEESRLMKVEAIKRGFYGGVLREPGSAFSRFTIKFPEEFSKHWMRELPPETPIEEAPRRPRQQDPSKSFIDLMEKKDGGAPVPVVAPGAAAANPPEKDDVI